MPSADRRALHVTRLSADFAAAASNLHIVGQPGTFLTELGPEVLAVFYRTLPGSTYGFGFAAVEEVATSWADPYGAATSREMVGFVSATSSVAHLFVEMATRHLVALGPPLAARCLRRPALALRSVQTALYPFLVHVETSAGSSAELLSIMVKPERRSLGIGALLLHALMQDCRDRQIELLDVTVDAANDGAQRFYLRFGFEPVKTFALYGRPMRLFRLAL